MKARLLRIVGSLAVVISAYAAYALTVVPLVEPSVELRAIHKELAAGTNRDPRVRLRRQWGRYFAADSWQLQEAKVLESDQAVFFVGDYHNLPDGRVELRPFTALLIPRDQRGSDGQIDPNSNKVIALDAPQGAILQFDEPFDMRRAKIGKLMGANLAGPVHIHNAPVQAPGSPNEVDIVTRDVQLVDDKIVTPHKVDFRFGPNVGSGRDLKITLAQRAGDDAKKTGANFDGIRSLELKHEVKVRVQMGNKGLMPGAPQKKNADKEKKPPAKEIAAQPAQGGAAAGKTGPAATAKKPDPPVEVTCQGPFFFDVEKSVATFTDRVDVLRLNPVGESDTMNCELLAIYFAPREEPKAPDKKPEPEPDRTSKDSLSKLEARMIEARGDPVIVRSPSNGGHVRCERLEYDIRNGNIRLEGQREVLLNQGTNEVRTRKLDYQPATTGRLGRLNCSGPGTLNGAMQDDPTRKYSARWTRQLLMQPEGELHRISLLGGAQMRMSDTGSLTAEEIYIWVSEAPQTAGPEGRGSDSPRAPAPPRAAGQSPGGAQQTSSQSLAAGAGGIQVERLLAIERVRIDSTQLTGATRRLEVWFDRPPAPVAAASVAAVQPAVPATTAPAPAAQPAPANPPSAPKPASPARQAPPQQTFDVAGNLLRLKVAAPTGGPLAVSEVTVEDNARLVETRTAKLGDKPLLVRGQTLHLEHAETPNAHVTVVGKPAYIEARGLTLSGAIIQMLKGDNRLWVDGAGKMTLPAKGNLTGGKQRERQGASAQAAAPPPGAAPRAKSAKSGPAEQTLEITWQGGMNFDGLQATYTRSVLAQTEHQWLRTDFLAVSLKRRIDFSAPPPAEGAGGGGSSEVELVDCRGGVEIESREFDERGLTSVDQMQLHTLWVNQTSGAIQGQGPGWVTRVSRGEAAGGAGNKPAAPAGKPPAQTIRPVAMKNERAAAAPAKKDDRLTYLHVTFERDLTGNVNNRELTFADQVRTVYGPILTWQATLNGDDMRSLGPEGIVMTCDQLTVREMPAVVRGERGTMELEATGQVLIEGQTFTAHSHRLTYSQAKDLLIFEGDGRSDAELFRQLAIGQQMTKATARKIMYWRTANRAEVDDARHLDLGNIPGGPALKPPTKSQQGYMTPIPGLTTPP